MFSCCRAEHCSPPFSPGILSSGLRFDPARAALGAVGLLFSMRWSPWRSLSDPQNGRQRSKVCYGCSPRFLRTPGGLLFRSLRRQGFDDSDVLQQFRWQAVSLLQVCRTVVTNPGLALSIFPDQDLQRKVDGAAGRGQHQRGARPLGCRRSEASWEAFSFPPFPLLRCGQSGQTA
jgi:hypothetical protein